MNKENFKFNSALKEMEQINETTGISQDYIGEISHLVTFYDFGGLPSVVKTIEKRPFVMKKYEERYANFADVVNDKNKERVKELDILVDKLNDILNDPKNINEEEFRQNINRVCFLIYGNDETKI
jgi:hypothetical protein